MRRIGRRAAVLAAAAVVCLGAGAARGETVMLFAAASTAQAIEEVVAAYEASHADRVKAVFAASSTLARQIAQGAPADIFLSANRDWMDYLEERGLLGVGSRVHPLANRLVLIAPAASATVQPVDAETDFSALLAGGRLAMGDPGHVPAGIYAKAALERLGHWPRLAGRLAYTSDVRGALALVERGEAAAGIVYATDAALSERVRVIGSFPAELTPPIAYALALVGQEPRRAARRFYDFLLGPEARRLFLRHGFLAPDRP